MELPQLIQTRQCNGCTACCSVIGVSELGKPYYTDCQHIKCSRCAIYDQRPQSCKDYVCLWAIKMVGAEQDRPDKLGYMFGFSEEFGKAWIDVFETTPKITLEQRKRAVELVNIAAKKYPLFSGVRYHFYNAKIGVGFKIKPPYPEGTFDIGNKYVQDQKDLDLLYHIPPGIEIPGPVSHERNRANASFNPST